MNATAAGFAPVLDPLETILPGAPRKGSPPPAAAGEWSPGWSSTSATLPRIWADGWDRGERCPAAPRGAAPVGGWREVGTAAGVEWRELHEKRRRVVGLLRRAGYVARHRWSRVNAAPAGERAKWAYTSGPAAGVRAVDPWSVAAELRGCGGGWYAQARITDRGELRAVALPRACGRAHLCPVCAARESASMARALRSLQTSGTGALVTLTHRDVKARSLAAELDRLRAAMSKLWSGRARAEWERRFSGWWYGVEVTRNDAAGWWHVHVHVLVKLHDGADVEDVAGWTAAKWEGATAAAAVAAGLPARSGWDPYAGGVTAQRWTTPGGGWWVPVDLSDPAQAYQACKYPTPAVELHPVALAEFVAVAHGRRWHDGGGEWRGVRARAAELAGTLGDDVEAPGYDIGTNVVRCGPRDVPALDTVAPGIGFLSASRKITPPELVPGSVFFTLSSSAPVEAIAAVVAPLGGCIYPVELAGKTCIRLRLPASVVGALVHEWHDATALQRAEIRTERDLRREAAGARATRRGRPRVA